MLSRLGLFYRGLHLTDEVAATTDRTSKGKYMLFAVSFCVFTHFGDLCSLFWLLAHLVGDYSQYVDDVLLIG